MESVKTHVGMGTDIISMATNKMLVDMLLGVEIVYGGGTQRGTRCHPQYRISIAQRYSYTE